MKQRLFISAVCVFLVAACSQPSSSTPAPSTITATIDFTATPMVTATDTPAPAVSTEAAPTATKAPTMSPEAFAYLDEALDIMEDNSLNRLTVDWDEMRALAVRLAGSAQTPADIHAVIVYLLPTVGGQHSRFLDPQEAAQLEQGTLAAEAPPRAKLLLSRLGYVAIQSFLNTNPEQGVKYATQAQQLIRDVDAHSPCGWIVDLRNNPGGNMYPMLAGLGPILGEGVAGKFVDPEGHESEWSYRDGKSLSGSEVVTQVNGEPYRLKAESAPVAVLIGFNTVSSGEAIAISFRGRPNTRSFGSPTAGYTTANAGFSLGDGAMILLTSAVEADRNGQVYGSYIEPDEPIDDKSEFAIIEEETIPQLAIDWLMAQPACGAQQ